MKGGLSWMPDWLKQYEAGTLTKLPGSNKPNLRLPDMTGGLDQLSMLAVTGGRGGAGGDGGYGSADIFPEDGGVGVLDDDEENDFRDALSDRGDFDKFSDDLASDDGDSRQRDSDDDVVSGEGGVMGKD